MKNKQIIAAVAFASILLGACDDNKMEWYRDPSHGDVSVSELPLKLEEQISRYAPLKEYLRNSQHDIHPEFKFGMGVGLDNYLAHEATTTIVNENFNDLTVGYAMKHGPMVNSTTGKVNFTKVDQLLANTQAAGLSVYGHTLVWHQNANAKYLNSLIADRVTVTPDGSDPMVNVVTNSDFETGTIAGWSGWGNSSTSSVSSEGEGYNSSYALKLVNPTAADAHSAQVAYKLPAALVVGKTYVYQTMVKATVVNADFTLQVQNSSDYSQEGYVTKTTVVGQWVQVQGEFVCSKEGLDRVMVNFGKEAGTYLLDNFKFGEKTVEKFANVLSNSNFEDGTINPWGSWGNGSSSAVSADGEGFEGGYCMVLTNPTSASTHSAQAAYTLPTALVVGKTYCLSARVKSTVALTNFQFSVQNSSTYSGEGYMDKAVPANSWVLVEGEFTCAQEGMDRFLINFGAAAATFYVDDIKFGEKNQEPSRAYARTNVRNRAVEITPLTPEEKKDSITKAMHYWIKEMVSHCKDKGVRAWDVVNEPMDDGKPSALKTGEGKELAEDEFYWQDYMGKEYAVKAFQWARKYGNPDDVLFINDYNLEYNLAKCDGLIEYVKYIDQTNGLPIVDGIGTQMHIDIDSDKEKIDQMFQKMAATGKKIKISELDIKVKTASPTIENYAQQSEMYEYVINSYFKYIPREQQYGITIWGVSDHPDEHVNWIPNDAPNVWDANYARKHAYKGVADGLAGRDVSLDFTGDLQP